MRSGITAKVKEALRILFQRTDALQQQADRNSQLQREDRRRLQRLGERVSWLLAWKAGQERRAGQGVGDNGRSAYEVMSMSRVRSLLEESFSLDELRTLCFDVGIEYENLPGTGTKAAKSREMVALSWRSGLFWKLVAMCRELRPGVAWPVQVE
jgi:hypothetical protein